MSEDINSAFEPNPRPTSPDSIKNRNQIALRIISENIINVLNQSFAAHDQWMQGWYQWANGMMMQMQPLPPQAYADFDARSRQLAEFVVAFKPSADVLKADGIADLSNLIENFEQGAKKSQDAWNAAQANMAASNHQAQMNIMKMNQRTNEDIFRMQQDTTRVQSGSFDRAHSNFMDYLRS